MSAPDRNRPEPSWGGASRKRKQSTVSQRRIKMQRSETVSSASSTRSHRAEYEALLLMDERAENQPNHDALMSIIHEDNAGPPMRMDSLLDDDLLEPDTTGILIPSPSRRANDEISLSPPIDWHHQYVPPPLEFREGIENEPLWDQYVEVIRSPNRHRSGRRWLFNYIHQMRFNPMRYQMNGYSRGQLYTGIPRPRAQRFPSVWRRDDDGFSYVSPITRQYRPNLMDPRNMLNPHNPFDQLNPMDPFESNVHFDNNNDRLF